MYLTYIHRKQIKMFVIVIKVFMTSKIINDECSLTTLELGLKDTRKWMEMLCKGLLYHCFQSSAQCSQIYLSEFTCFYEPSIQKRHLEVRICCLFEEILYSLNGSFSFPVALWVLQVAGHMMESISCSKGFWMRYLRTVACCHLLMSQALYDMHQFEMHRNVSRFFDSKCGVVGAGQVCSLQVPMLYWEYAFHFQVQTILFLEVVSAGINMNTLHPPTSDNNSSKRNKNTRT